MTLGDLKTAVRTNLGGREDLDSLLATYINWGLYDAWKLYMWPWYMATYEFSTVANQADYTKPNGIIIDLRRKSGVLYGVKLVRLPVRYYDRLVPDPSKYTPWKPTHYIEFGNTISLWRVPDGAYDLVLRYQKEPATLVNDADATEASQLDPIVVSFATHHGFAALNEPTLMAVWYRRAKSQADDLWLKVSRFPDAVTHREANWPTGEYWANPFVRRI